MILLTSAEKSEANARLATKPLEMEVKPLGNALLTMALFTEVQALRKGPRSAKQHITL